MTSSYVVQSASEELFFRFFLVVCFFFFFFQAEDGIRDTSVTGVQTCALPIFAAFTNAFASRPSKLVRTAEASVDRSLSFRRYALPCVKPTRECSLKADFKGRSEERRVGKECRTRRSGEQ